MTSQPTQPLTDAELAEVRSALADLDAVVDGVSGVKGRYGWRLSGVSQHVNMHADLVRLLAEVDRLRAELDSMTRFAEDLREERDRRLRAEGERGVERDVLAAKIEATAELHPAWFCETCNSPGPCLTRLRLGLDQDGNGQA